MTMAQSVKMKVGDFVQCVRLDALAATLVCHKYLTSRVFLCGATGVPNLSHEEWRMVTCLRCLALREMH